MKARQPIALLTLLLGCQEEPAAPVTPATGNDPVQDDEAEIIEPEGDWPVLADLDSKLEEIMEASHIPGLSACIIQEAELTWCGAYGWANIDTKQAVQTDTPFMLASISKLFTSTALMQLWEDELFALDDPVSSSLDFPFDHPSDDTPITYRQLLSHVGGVRDNWDVMNPLYVDGDSPIDLGDFMADYYDPEGSYYHESRNWVSSGVEQQMVYTNMGFALLGHLVEQLSGEGFPSFCQDRIFDPLEMGQTAWHLASLDEATVAMPYIWSGGAYQATGHYGYPDYPNGGLRTGAEQLARFMAMAMGGGEYRSTRILEEETFIEMLTAHYPDLDDTQGLSWYTWSLDGEAIWGHDGGDVGVATGAGIRWSDETGFVFLMNSSGTRSDTFVRLERALLEGAAEL